jgi:high-affinity iron transporter
MAALLAVWAQPAAAEPPWLAADTIRADLAEAQTKQLFDEDGSGAVRSAARALSGPLRAGLRQSAPRELAEIERSLKGARVAADSGDEVALAVARGRITAALRRGAMAVAADAAARRDVAAARSWMQIRDFRKTTRYTRPGVSGTEALEALQAGEISAHEAVLQIEKDLLDSFQARLLTNLDEASQAAERRFAGRFGEATAIVYG